MNARRIVESEYMHWVKTASQARFNLVSSDLLHCPLSLLELDPAELEINGPGGYGFRPLNEAIGGKCGVDSSLIVPSIGTSLANHVAFAALLAPGDEVLLEQPTYELLLSTLGYLGARVRRFHRRHEDGFAVDPTELRRQVTAATKLIVLTNLHNPSSAFTHESTLAEVGEIAQSVGARVLVDEVYLDAVTPSAPRSAFHLGNTFVTTNSLTKVYGLSGLRCGWIIAEAALAERMRRISDLFHSTASHPSELISIRAFQRLATLAERSRALLRANTQLLNQFYQRCGALEARPHVHGLVAFPRFTGTNIEEFYTLLRSRYETAVAPGRFFGMEDHFRIGIGKETELLREALERMRLALASLA